MPINRTMTTENDELAEIVEQTHFRTNYKNGRNGRRSWAISPGLQRSHVAREKPAPVEAPPPAPPVEKVNNTTACPELFFALASDYDAFRAAIRARVEQLNISRLCLDNVAGVPSGYTSKLLAPCGRKKIGQFSLELMLKAVGLKMVLIDDREALAKFQPLYEERASSQARPGNSARRDAGVRSRKKPARVKKPARNQRGKPYLSR